MIAMSANKPSEALMPMQGRITEDGSPIAAAQTALLTQARDIISAGRQLAALEQSGVLQALLVLVENAIGKAKQWLKAGNQTVSIYGYEAFKALVDCRILDVADLTVWKAAIGLRNRIVHGEMNVDMEQVLRLITTYQVQFIAALLRREISQ